jgi:uncharacterized protein
LNESGSATNSVLLDSSFLFALNNPGDRQHQKVLEVARIKFDRYLIVDLVLAETAYMIRERIGQKAVLNFLDALVVSPMQLEPVLKADLARAREIMSKYASADFDLADCCIMAISERLNITKVCTLDRRDFGIFVPSHCPYLEILP